MRIRTLRAFCVLLSLAALTGPSPAQAQVRLLGEAGLGRRIRPLDARARAMGASAVVLHGGNFSAVNPAAAVHLTVGGAWATFMPENRSVKGEARGDFRTQDVPLIRVGWPISERWVASVGFGSFLDQDFGVQFTDTLSLSTGDVEFQEARTADGGITQFRFELAGIMAERWSLGLAAQLYSGEVRRSVVRAFESGSGFLSYRSRAAIQYQGWGFALGTEFEPVPEMLVGAVFGWGFGLDVENDSTGASDEVGLPLALDVGGSWQLTPDLIVAMQAGWEDWSKIRDDSPETGANDVFRFGAGAELKAISGTSSEVFLRAGASFERRPFRLRSGWPWERAFGFGLGLNLANGRARLDGTIELGRRGDIERESVEESFTRLSISLGVFGR